MVIMGSGALTGQRGNSHLIGAVLLVGIVMAGALVVLLGGQAIIDDTQSQGESELAGQTLRQMDGVFQSGPNDENSEVDVPDELEGDFTVNESSDWELQLHTGSPDDSYCNSGRRNLGRMEYTDDNDRLVGYEGGGIWKETESGATMDSPPDMTYRNGSLNLAFPNITGTVTSTRSISATSNASRSAMRDRNLTKALYTDYEFGDDPSITDVECPPSEVDAATLTIYDSRFAPAWMNYFEDNYDGHRVRVQTPDPDPGEEVRVRFMLGDVSDPDYNVTHIGVSRSGSDIVIEPTIKNEGGLDGDSAQDLARDVVLTKSPPTDVSVETDVEIDSGDTAMLTYTISATEFSTGTTYDLTVDPQDNAPKSVEVEFVGSGDSDLQIVDVSGPQNATRNADKQVTVKLENHGDVTAVQPVKLYLNGAGDPIHTENVEVHPIAGSGSTTTVSFTLPTDTVGMQNWRVETDDGHIATGDYVVGEQPYFATKNVDAPSQVSTYTEFDIEATIENTKEMRGKNTVEIRIMNVSRDSRVANTTETLVIDGTEYTGGTHEKPIALTHSFESGEEGQYEYVVETPNETTKGTFTVGPAIKPNFQIDSIDTSQNPTYYGETTFFDVTITNRGATPGEQQIQLVHENGTSLWTDSLYLEPGEQQTINKSFAPRESQFEPDWTTVTLETANASEDFSLGVIDGNRYERDDGELIIKRSVEAEVTVLGAELEGEYGGNVINDPIQMDLRVENSTGVHNIKLWRDLVNNGDVNDPRAERTMVKNADPYDPSYDSDNPYKYSLQLEENASFSVFGQSRSCWGREETDVTWGDVDMADGGTQDLVGEECSDPGDVNLRISDDANSDNVVILLDGDKVPSYGNAESYQRDLQDMLGSRIQSDGNLSLAPGESVFVYELSEEGAHPDDAPRHSGDPDYNDAVVLFRTLNTERELKPPADIDVEVIDAPSTLRPSSGGDVRVEVNNTGGQIGSANIQWDIKGTGVHQETNTGNLEPGERETMYFDIPADLEPGTYTYSVDVGSDPNEDYIGTFTVGSPNESMFQINSMSAPAVVESDHDETAEVVVENTGRREDTQSVRLVDEDGYTDSKAVTLGPGESTTVDLDLPTRSPSGDDGEYVTYEVETEDTASGKRMLYVGESEVHIRSVEVGTVTYGESDLIERRQLDKLGVKLENTGSIGGQRDVEVTIEDGDGNTDTKTKGDIRLGDGPIGDYPVWKTFDVEDPKSGDSALSNGYYGYTIAVKNDGTTTRTWSGEIFVQENPDVDGSQNSSSPIGVDSNEVVISGD